MRNRDYTESLLKEMGYKIHKPTQKQIAAIKKGLEEAQLPKKTIVVEENRTFEVIDYPPANGFDSTNMHGYQTKTELVPEVKDYCCPICGSKEFITVWDPPIYSPEFDGRMGPQRSKSYETKTIAGFECPGCSVVIKDPRRWSLNRLKQPES